MSGNLLQTKLYVPRPRATRVRRPRLLAQLDQGLHAGCKLTLVSAPAGFGKTTLLSAWIASLDRPAAWLSLDRDDDDPARFLSYFIAALQQIKAGTGEGVLELLDIQERPPLEMLLTELVNEICRFPEPFLLVLDDFHLLGNREIHDALTFTLDNLPPPMHLVLASRADPPWSLVKMRGRGELLELRAADLRFTEAEVAEFLNRAMGLDLSATDIAALDGRTEGWVAGLQMAALSLARQKDASRFIQAFSGSNRFILDYLVEEVLNQQPPSTQEFLLKTAVLPRMSAPLCDAVMKREGSQALLDRLESSNLFLVRLDDERHWFRYHHLFGDLLRRRLQQQYPHQVEALHRRAGAWFEEAGLPEEAIPHALDGKDLERAARLMEGLAEEFHNLNKERSFARWLDRLPHEMIRKRPWLAVSRARVRWSNAEESLQWAEEALTTSSTGEGTPGTYSAAEKKKLIAFIATLWSHRALVEGDVTRASKEAEKALALLPEDGLSARLLIALAGIAWAQGDRATAEKTYVQAVAAGRKMGERQFVVTSLCGLGLQQLKRGWLHAAHQCYQEALEAAERPDGTRMPIVAFALIRLGDLHRERNDLAAAEEFLLPGFELGSHSRYHDVVVDAHVNMARLHLARHRRDKALKTVLEAEQLIDKHPADAFLIGWADECLMRIWLARGELDAAVHWMEKRGLTVDGALSYHHDLHHINLARVLIAQGMHNPAGPYLKQAQQLLARLLAAAKKAGWVHESIKILILQALAFATAGKRENAVEALRQALALAEPGGYVRLFIDEGAPMAQLLAQVRAAPQRAGHRSAQGIGAYAGTLLAVLEAEGRVEPAIASRSAATLSEPLSERESQVLQLLTTHLSSTEIASELHLSVNTIRFHIKNIYGKLNVHSRSDAVQTASDLGLL